MSAEPPPPPQVSPDGKFYWDGQRWLPMASQAPAQPPAEVQAFPGQPRYLAAPPRQNNTGRNLAIGCVGLIALIIVLAAIGSHGTSPSPTSSLSTESPVPSESPLPSPSPISEAQYKASAENIPYVQLEKDPASLAGTVVTYKGQVVQYDSATTTSNLRVNVTPDGFGGYTDTIWLDVDPSQTANVYRGTIIQFWGEVVGPYTYTSVTNAQITIPEVSARYVEVSS